MKKKLFTFQICYWDVIYDVIKDEIHMKNILFENLNHLIVMTFEWFKFIHIFISPYELQFYLFFNFFVVRKYVFESFRWGIIFKNFVGFPFRIPNFKMTSITLNTSSHIDLGKFVGD
jgi:hypothetical protein